MSDSQMQLTEFDQADASPGNTGARSGSGQEPVDSQPSIGEQDVGEFDPPDGGYPADQIGELAQGSIDTTLCVENGTVDPTFVTIAGEGGMGTKQSITSPDAVFTIASACLGKPVLITGGGMNTPMGSGAVFGRLTDVVEESDTVQVTVDELYHRNGTARTDSRSRTLGSYELSVPATERDCIKAIQALSLWETDEIDYLNPVKRHREQVACEQIDQFKALSPADKIDTPEYSTTLEVVSEPYETHAVIPRGTLNDRTVRVLSVSVSNPRGGYYQLGIGLGSQSRPGTEIPTCYISTSYKSPPTPNTAFTRESRFDSTEIEVTPIDHPPNPEVVEPNEEVMNSPLPEPRMRTPLDEIDGIGETTARKIRRKADEKVSAESVAHTLFGEGDTHQASQRGIRSVLESLPNSDRIFKQLESYTPTEED